MNCIKHLDEPAVAQCGNCGAGLCRECVETSAYTIENKPLCRDCNIKIAQELIDSNTKAKNKASVKLAFVGIFFVLGLILFLIAGVTSDPDNARAWGWLLMGVGGIPSVFGSMKKSEAEKAVDDIHIRMDANDGCTYLIFGYIVRIAITLLLAPIAALWHIYKNVKNKKNAETQIQDATLTLQALTAN